ncbi:site-specific integrase [Synechococcus sp. RSCCF101]|uniref:tyrosine-type recombinase/integrase n=1 Tax=Synechococcus sp. RSCCF101 TaxID=2511069 RepID=UPI001244F7F8|nr:tyrosine-type recombinase/integrase [Synechococcus sp. RSCCF101]QEY32031.1 site-specific integrase [Synechococcus sp. RSCCF101]
MGQTEPNRRRRSKGSGSHRTTYLTTRPGRHGFYFQRSVPADVQAALGRKLWKRKAGNTPQEARQQAALLLAETEREIAVARGELTLSEQEQIDTLWGWRTPQALLSAAAADKEEAKAEGVDVCGFEELGPDELWPRLPEEEQYRLWRRLQGRLKGDQEGVVGRTTEELLELVTRLKKPARTTVGEWRRHLDALLKCCGKTLPTSLERPDAQKYRDHLLDTVSGGTAKTRLNYLSGLWNLMVEEGWVTSNVFSGLSKRIRAERVRKEPFDVQAIDRKVGRLPKREQLLYWIMRWTGSHVSEAAGLRAKDISLDESVIHFASHSRRPLKTGYREREIPIHPSLMVQLEMLLGGAEGETFLFPWAEDERTGRWGANRPWQRKIGISPKALRDSVATQLRDADVNERVVGAILGHTPKNSTGVYGTVTHEAMKRAICMLK